MCKHSPSTGQTKMASTCKTLAIFLVFFALAHFTRKLIVTCHCKTDCLLVVRYAVMLEERENLRVQLNPLIRYPCSMLHQLCKWLFKIIFKVSWQEYLALQNTFVYLI